MMLKSIDPMIRKLSASGMYYRDMAKVLRVGIAGLYQYTRDKGIPQNFKKKCRGDGKDKA